VEEITESEIQDVMKNSRDGRAIEWLEITKRIDAMADIGLLKKELLNAKTKLREHQNKYNNIRKKYPSVYLCSRHPNVKGIRTWAEIIRRIEKRIELNK
jgi:hypothetical protein